MGHGGYTLELSLKDSVSAGLKDMGRALSNVRELVGSLRVDVSALNKESGQAVSGLDLGKLAEGAADQLEGLSKGALQELDAAFRDSGKTMADYYSERRRQAGETADMERGKRFGTGRADGAGAGSPEGRVSGRAGSFCGAWAELG
ncbi:hypothetical protein [Bilophila wadsworthia]|uniref:hypothetical protein n=1 Tax=Bilophila wadsworthia TaxID=35833 RepID=UPI00351FBF83